MNIQTAAVYMNLGYRVRRTSWNPKDYMKARPILERVLVLNEETYDNIIETKALEYMSKLQNQN